MPRRILLLTLLAPLLLGTGLLTAGEFAYEGSAEICAADMRARLTYLASDEMKGRDAISPEAMQASAYIAATWRSLGLLPKGTDGTFFQPFTIPQPVLQEGNLLEVVQGEKRSAYEVEKDWNPFSVTASGDVEGDVVFCGYGIRAPGPKYGYDDYAGVDVKGKVVLVFRKNPGWKEARHAAFMAKLALAAKQGAVGLLLCNNPDTTKGGKDVISHWSQSLGAPAGSGPIPYAFVTQDVAKSLLASTGETLESLEASLRKDGPRSTPLEGVRVHLRTALATTRETNARNVVGFLPGRDPDVANEVVIVGGHYDHIGTGLYASAGGPEARGKIHNGADDNGSGTVAVIELAEYFAQAEHRPRRSLLFIAFTAEERGLLGSRHYVQHPLVPLDDVVAMLNMDMVGRSKEGRLQIGGVGTAKGLKDLVAAANREHGLKIAWDEQGTAPSDSTVFFGKNLPVLFFFTGIHKDYHRPTDDVDLINFPDMERICLLIADVTAAIGEREERLVFTRPRQRPVLGVMPSPAKDPRGVVVGQVVPGGPAAAGGMRAGDVILTLAGHAVTDRMNLLAVLGELGAGHAVPIEVQRGDERVTLQVTLGKRSPRRRGR